MSVNRGIQESRTGVLVRLAANREKVIDDAQSEMRDAAEAPRIPY